jgi:hypothetical protein
MTESIDLDDEEDLLLNKFYKTSVKKCLEDRFLKTSY